MSSRFNFGVTIIFIICLVLAFFILTGNQYVKTSVDTVGATFASGDSISIIKQPVILPPEIQKLLQTTNSSTVTQENLPSTFQNLAAEQKRPVQPNETKPEITGGLSGGKISANAQLVATQMESGIPTHKQGDTIFVSGQVNTKKLPQQLTITYTCCGTDYFGQIPHYPTDAQGNFAVPIVTSGRFPTGLWTVTITWTGNDGFLKSYDWQFNLVE